MSKEITNYKQTLKERAKQDLKDYLDIAYSMMDSLFEENYGHRLRNIIEVAESVLVSKQRQVENDEVTIAEAQEMAKEEMKDIKYDGTDGYIWINDTTYPIPKMIMHPKERLLNGLVLDDPKYNCAIGNRQNIWVTSFEITQRSARNEGFFYYLWDKQNQNCLNPNVMKLAYVKLFPQWGWIIGTSIYINEVKKDIKDEIKAQIKAMRYNDGKGYFWLNNTDESSPQFVMHPINPSRENKPLEGKLSKYKDATRKFIKVCREKKERPEDYGRGYVNYVTDKSTEKGVIKNVPKLSYVRLHEPLDWIIGTGTYIDDIDETIKEKRREVNKKINDLLTNIIIATILIILFIAIMSYLVNRYFFPKAKSKLTFMTMKKTIANEKKTDYKQSGPAISPASTAELNKIVRKHVWFAMAVGLIPIPLFNFVSVTAVQISMLSDIASKFGVTSSSEKIKTLLTSLVGGAIPLATSGYMARVIRAIPIVNHTVGFVTMPMVSGASTYAVGKIFILHFSKGGTFSTFKEEDAKKDYVRIVNEEQKSIG